MTQVLSTSLRATDQDIDDYLMHYGVKGMRWGVRKDRNKSGGTRTKKKPSSSESPDKQGPSESSKSGSSSGSTKSSKNLTTDQKIDRLFKISGEKNEILNYIDEVKKAAKEVTDSQGETWDGPLKTILEFHPKGIDIADDTADKMGFYGSISDKEVNKLLKDYRKREFRHDDIESDIDDYLMHYGVKGMKWGVRKDDRGKVKSVLKRDYKAKEDTEFDSIREVSKPVDTSIRRIKKIYKNANTNIKRSIRNINKIPEYKDADLTNPKNKLTKKYHSEINKAVTKQLNSSSVLANSRVKQGFIPIFDYDTSRGARVKAMHQIAPGNPLTSKDAKDLAAGSQRGTLNTKDRVLRTAQKAAIASSIAANSFGVGTVNALGVGVAAAAAYTNHGPSRSTADMFVPKGLESLANDAGVSARSPLGIKLFGGNANDVEIMKRQRLRHAAGSDYDILVGLVYKIDNNGQVYDFEADVMASKEDVQHNEMNDIDDYLMHYGVKGMKWGVRKDGKPQGYQGGGGSSKSKKKKKSSTVDRVKSNLRKTAGNAKKKVSKISDANKDRKEARAKAKARAKAASNVKREMDVEKAQSEAKAVEAQKKSNPPAANPDITKTIITDRTRTGAMTDAELKATIQRMHLENSYAKLVREATPKSTSQKLKEFAKATAVDIAKQQVKRVAGDFVGNLVDQAVSGGVADAKAQKKKKNESKPKDDTSKSDSKPKTDTPKSESKPKTEAPKSTPTTAPDSKTKPVAPTWRPTPPGPGRPPNKPPAPTWRPTPPDKPLSGAPIFGDRGRNYKGTRRARDVINNNASVTVAELMERRKRRQR